LPTGMCSDLGAEAGFTWGEMGLQVEGGEASCWGLGSMFPSVTDYLPIIPLSLDHPSREAHLLHPDPSRTNPEIPAGCAKGTLCEDGE
jgi:hypothetical protein